MALSSTLVELSSILAETRRSVCELSNDHPISRRDLFAQPFRRGRVVTGGDGTDGDVHACCTPAVLRPPTMGNFVSATVPMTDRFCFFLDTRRIAAMHQDGAKLSFFDLRFDARHDIALEP